MVSEKGYRLYRLFSYLRKNSKKHSEVIKMPTLPKVSKKIGSGLTGLERNVCAVVLGVTLAIGGSMTGVWGAAQAATPETLGNTTNEHRVVTLHPAPSVEHGLIAWHSSHSSHSSHYSHYSSSY